MSQEQQQQQSHGKQTQSHGKQTQSQEQAPPAAAPKIETKEMEITDQSGSVPASAKKE